MKRKVLGMIACTLALIGIAVYSYYQDDGSFNLIGGGIVAFWIAIALGIIIKLIRAKRGNRIREAFGPLVGAADAYQAIVLSRPTMDENIADAAKGVSTDKFTTGP